MKRRRTLPLGLVALLVAACAPREREEENPLTPDLPPVEHPPSENGIVAPGPDIKPAVFQPQPSPEWTPLFDGASLAGFVSRGGEARYFIESGAIVGETRPNTPNTFLCTEREYDDFILEFDVLVDRELNSGVQVRSRQRDDGRVAGYQVEIDPTSRGYSGGVYEESGRGWLAQPTPDQVAAAPFLDGEWNRYRVEAIGPRIRTWINGVPVADLIDDDAASGFIGLQVHGVGAREDPLQVRWREIRLLELP